MYTKTSVIKLDISLLNACVTKYVHSFLRHFIGLILWRAFWIKMLIQFSVFTEYYLEDCIQMLGFIPPPSDKKKKKDKDELGEEMDQEVWSPCIVWLSTVLYFPFYFVFDYVHVHSRLL